MKVEDVGDDHSAFFTHSASLPFSEKTRSKKSPSVPGSKVDGTMT